MLQVPNVVGLTMCEQIITDAATRHATLVNTFSHLRCPVFPSPPQRFAISTVLTDALGDAIMTLVLHRLDTLEIIRERRWSMTFADPLRAIRLILRYTDLSFPVSGGYQFTLLADSEWVAQAVLRVSD